jgi:UDP-N-acetylmuramyl-tripeptide synthetase
VLVVDDTRAACARLAARFYGMPAERLRLIGVTGTNGKTTTAYLLSSVLRSAGIANGMIGTVEYRIGRRVVPALYTTPPAEELHRLFADMAAAGCACAVMEVSSHALALRRVDGLRFAVSVFTNLTQDHLDFHGSMDAYRDAKALLFRDHTAGIAVLNADDPASRSMATPRGTRVRSYGTARGAAVRISEVRGTLRGTRCTLTTREGAVAIRSPLAGTFNAWNLAAAYAACSAMGIPDEAIVAGIRRMRSVPGRFEQIRSADGVTGIVDYAHTPDALAKALGSIRALLPLGARVITVFGCGGERDREKRPVMGAIAAAQSDMTIVTSDNPRGETPAAIIRDIVAGIPAGARAQTRVRRDAAIRLAVTQARAGDVILVAGKGHETTQLTAGRRRHFDDREQLREEFRERRGGVRA